MRVLVVLLCIIHYVYGEHCMVTPDPVTGHVSAADLEAALAQTSTPTIIGTASYSDYSTSGFYSCTALKSIEIPASVTEIGYQAFYKTGLTSINFNNAVNLATIHALAFWKYTALTSVDLSGATALETIGMAAFRGEFVDEAEVTTLTTATVPACTKLFCGGLASMHAFPYWTTIVKTFARQCYASAGVTTDDILSQFSPEELRDFYRAKGNCPS